MSKSIFPALLQRAQGLISSPHNALHIGIALILIFFLSKLYLISWYYFNQDLNVLSTIKKSSWLLLPAMDTAVSVMILGLVFLLHFTNSFLPRAKTTNKVISIATYSAITAFITISFKTQIVYGSPFDIDLYRSAGDLSVMKDSLLSYVGIEEVIITTLAIASYYFAGFLSAKLTTRIRTTDLRHASLLSIVLSGLLLIPPALAYYEFRNIYTFSLKKNAIVHFIRYYYPAPSALNLSETKERLLLNSDKEFTENLWHHPGLMDSENRLAGDKNAKHLQGIAKGMNLILILLESTGAPHLSPKSSPNLNKLKGNSLNFEHHYTTASTSIQSAYSVFYSDYVGKIDLRSVYGETFTNTSLNEIFYKNNYKTAVFQSGFLSYTDFEYLWKNKGVETLVGASELYKSTNKTGWSWGAFEETTINEMSKWLIENKNSKFFLTYRPVFPHQPYFTPVFEKPFSEQSWEGKHKNVVFYVDKNISQLLRLLDDLDLTENTVVAVLADHGETTSRFPVGHGLAMSEEEIRVPFFIHHKNLFSGREDLPVFSNHLDVSPTLADMFGLESAENWKGRSLLKSPLSDRLMFIATNHSREEGIIDNRYLYTINRNSHHEEIKDLITGEAIESEDMPFYNKAAQEFQKWAIWQHLQ